MENNFALFLSRRQKRIKFWSEALASMDNSEKHSELRNKLKLYQDLLNSAAFATDLTEREKHSRELESLETVIGAEFDSLRLLTNPTGSPAFTDYSTRGGRITGSDKDTSH